MTTIPSASGKASARLWIAPCPARAPPLQAQLTPGLRTLRYRRRRLAHASPPSPGRAGPAGRARAGRLPSHRRAGHPRRHRATCWSTACPPCTWSSSPGPTRRWRWDEVRVPGACSPSCGLMTSASQDEAAAFLRSTRRCVARSRVSNTHRPGRRLDHRAAAVGARALVPGAPADAATDPRAEPIVISSPIWPKRWCSSSRRPCNVSWNRRPFSPVSARPCATPSPGAATGEAMLARFTRRISSSHRWTGGPLVPLPPVAGRPPARPAGTTGLGAEIRTLHARERATSTRHRRTRGTGH